MSKSPLNSRRRVFLTQDEPSDMAGFIEKKGSKLDLSSLKRKYDIVKQENIKKVQYLDWIRGKALELKSSATTIESDMKRFEVRYEKMQGDIENATLKLNQEFELKKVYEHMYMRNKTEGTHLDIKVNKFSDNVRSARHRLEFEKEKERKIKDRNYRAKNIIKDLRIKIKEDQEKYTAQTEFMDETLRQRNELIRKQEERSRREAEILELAAIKNRETHEKTLREQININKILFDLLTEKEVKYKKAGEEIEKAFQDMKTSTGIYNHKDILNKFTVRNETQNKLIESVEQSETTLEKLRNHYYLLKARLKDTMLVDEHCEDSIDGKDADFQEILKRLENVREQEKKSTQAFKIAEKWSKRMCKKLEIERPGGFCETVDLITQKILSLVDREKGLANDTLNE